MSRDYEIIDAFRLTIKRDMHGRDIISTSDFIKEHHQLNRDFTASEANSGIEVHKLNFRDISVMAGEDRIFQVFNPNGGM